MKKIPKYIKVPSVKTDGTPYGEWLTRLYDEKMDDDKGGKKITPYKLLNRYYSCMIMRNKYKSVISDRKDKSRYYLTFEELEKIGILTPGTNLPCFNLLSSTIKSISFEMPKKFNAVVAFAGAPYPIIVLLFSLSFFIFATFIKFSIYTEYFTDPCNRCL